MDITAGDDEQWEGVKRKYFFSDTYYLPLSLFDGGASAATEAGGGGGEGGAAVREGESAADAFVRLNGSAVSLLAASVAGGDFDLRELLATEVRDRRV